MFDGERVVSFETSDLFASPSGASGNIFHRAKKMQLTRLLQLIFVIEKAQGGPPSDIKWDISHCVDEVISPGVGEEQHSKVIVSRYYPSPMGNNWQCEYKIQNPDTQMKIMVEFLFFDLARCDLQNITIVDWKT